MKDNDFKLRNFDELMQHSAPQPFIVAKYSDPGRRFTKGAMLKDASGDIYYGGRRNDIRETPKDVRRAWCRLTGMTNAALEDAVKEYRKRRQDAQREERLQDVQHQARVLGYKLVAMAHVEPEDGHCDECGDPLDGSEDLEGVCRKCDCL